MARPYWTGQIQISLVSFGVQLFVATEVKGEIHFHQISRKTGERVRHQKVLQSAADQHQPGDIVEKDEIVKGYEYRKGQYVTIEPGELDNLRVPSKHTMEVTQFVDINQIDPQFYEKPYFVLPDGDDQSMTYAVVCKALLETGKVALSKIAFAGREHIVAIRPVADKAGGMMAYTLRYADELRSSADYFRDLKHPAVDEDSLDLAKQLIQRRTATFDPTKFTDGYEVALKQLVEAKVAHAPIPQDETPAGPNKVINLMDALRKSIGETPSAGRKEPAKAVPGEGLSLVKPGKKSTPAKSPRRKSA